MDTNKITADIRPYKDTYILTLYDEECAIKGNMTFEEAYEKFKQSPDNFSIVGGRNLETGAIIHDLYGMKSTREGEPKIYLYIFGRTRKEPYDYSNFKTNAGKTAVKEVNVALGFDEEFNSGVDYGLDPNNKGQYIGRIEKKETLYRLINEFKNEVDSMLKPKLVR